MELKRVQSNIGMGILLISWSMLFAALFLGYFVFRFFEKEFSAKRKVEGCKYLLITIVLACSFLFMQFHLWGVLKNHGLYVNAGIFPSLLYGFTWIHFAHIGLALPALGLLWFCLARKNIFNLGELFIINLGRFWHFLGVIWLMMFLGLFVF